MHHFLNVQFEVPDQDRYLLQLRLTVARRALQQVTQLLVDAVEVLQDQWVQLLGQRIEQAINDRRLQAVNVDRSRVIVRRLPADHGPLSYRLAIFAAVFQLLELRPFQMIVVGRVVRLELGGAHRWLVDVARGQVVEASLQPRSRIVFLEDCSTTIHY